MGKIRCVREIGIDAGHRVLNHESKCRTPHGHRYKIEIHAEAPDLDEIGRVIDFSVLKEKIGGWLDLHWDHTFLVFQEDKSMINALTDEAINPMKPIYVTHYNPTAENMADDLLENICPNLLRGTDVVVTKVVVWETPNCKAISELNNDS